LPEFKSVDAANELIGALIMGLSLSMKKPPLARGAARVGIR
jgi:hypothetical protein